jgi:cytochrome c oxidase accessory protein FixG
MVTLIVFIVLFTVVYGRVFCGWVCPQTIFMEMVFRKIEYWIDGDYKQQQRLAKLKWNREKISKRVLKHSIFFLISFGIANTFLAYVIGADALIAKQTGPVSENMGTLLALILFTGIFYFVFSWFREQVCIVACPYGRLQGVMLDRNSIVVAYDYIRGELRGKFKKNEDRKESGKGDCIDCNQCVAVCPTGIDIRNGTQLECVNCTACIDACDQMMDAVNLPRGLIRFTSEEGITKQKQRKITIRSVAYTFILVLLLGVLGYLLGERPPTDTTVLRTPGMLYQERDNGTFSNLYNWKTVNK